ncbi:E3 ubiquitin-protein ligase RNF144A isoform X2 [Anthonomus grandis grandis]|uniref:E3 ubiquitin-protein ligase RNF144A isoform X2 n=1 Tax=Anthonomus grandis grandis TaxID=2921223 RepID=UPI0021666D0E|nr:E3 ubiquitin-protein ligase RNF144A isoform X2 [Anthonomus grandis grandis]
MTLPVTVRPLRTAPDNRPTAHLNRRKTASCQTREDVVSGGRVQPPLTKITNQTQNRRSWHVGYGALHDRDTTITTSITIEAVAGAISGASRRVEGCKKEKVAEQATLLDSTQKRPAIVKKKTRDRPPVPIHTESDAAANCGGGGMLPRLRLKGRRESGNSDENDKLVHKNGQPPTILKTAASLASLRNCETVLALSGILRSASSSSSIGPLQPQNRLRVAPTSGHSRLCSRCSSLLTLASGSRYSLDSVNGFTRVPTTPEETLPPILCKLCLDEVPLLCVSRIRQCDCAFCLKCMKSYVEFEISEGAYDISCPDAQCSSQGVLEEDEIQRLVGSDLLEKHNKYRLNREIELDKSRMWCPRAGCETVCRLCPTQPCSPQSVQCPTCSTDFCSNCKLEWHEGVTCDEHTKRLAKEGKTIPDAGIPFDPDLIKRCPMCGVPIEKDEGCAQMMCKRCKHVFCWYCLASLDDDFLLRHYDKGPCKNKLGHSRASVIWHRTQVIGIFAGFGILLLVASPLLLLAAPCIVCCKCRICNAGTTKLNHDDEIHEDR